MTTKGKVTSIGVDFITCTGKLDKLFSPEADGGLGGIDVLIPSGELAKIFALRGYKGFRQGQFSYGTKDESFLIQLAGDLAARNWRKLHKVAKNVSRIDLQVTVSLRGEPTDLAVEAFNSIADLPDGSRGNRKYTLLQSLFSTSTLTIGSRESDYFGRLYDRFGVEKAEQACTDWRYEVEYKSDVAKQVAARMPEESEEYEAITATVYKWFLGRGVMPVFSPADPDRALQVTTEPREEDKTLSWLNRSVAPCLERFGEQGLLPVVERALGYKLVKINSDIFNEEE